MKNQVKNFYGFSHPSSIAVYLNEYPLCGPHVIETNETLFESVEQSFLFFNSEQNIYQLPAMDPWFPSQVITLKRLRWLCQALSPHPEDVFLCSKKSLSQKTIPAEEFQKNFIQIFQGSKLPSDQKLSEIGYFPSEKVEEPGFFSRRGYILDVFSPGSPHPIRIETMGDEVQSIRKFDPHTGRSLHHLNSVQIIPAMEVICQSPSRFQVIQKLKAARQDISDFPDHLIRKLARGLFFPEISLMASLFYERPVSSLDFFKTPYTLWSDEKNLEENQKVSDHFILKANSQAKSQKKSFHSFLTGNFFAETLKSPPSKISLHPMICENKNIWPVRMIEHLSWSSLKKLNSFIFIGFSNDSQLDRIRFYLSKEGFEFYTVSEKERFWKTWQEEQFQDSNKIHLIPAQVPCHFQTDGSYFLNGALLLGKMASTSSRRRVFTSSLKANALNFSDLKEGDLLADSLYGVGLYKGLKKLTFNSVEGEYIELEYKDQDKLYIPVSQLKRLFHFKSGLSTKLPDSLGGSQWIQKMAQAKKNLQQMVLELLKLYSLRSRIRRPPFKEPGADMKLFEDQFPFEETPDQMKSIQDVLSDMRKNHPMERLIIGDSGYGKTEVAMRAAFKAVEDGFQVAFLVPTTILSLQHFENFKQRFKDWPVRIECINRLTPSFKVKNLLKDVFQSKVDILIGSHRLLSPDVKFNNPGLLVIDEEHRFGVRQKERLKKIKTGLDCIYMSATPIPRTLHLSLSGMKDISMISTSPKNRIRVEVFVLSFQKEKIKRIIEQELGRGGQVIFVHNRIQSLHKIQEQLKKNIPEVQITMVHGQMPERILEQNILQFFNHKSDILLCTTIVETGMDFQRAGTIVVNDAHLLGLSQLYQLKGRVGRRAHVKPYCYFIVPEHLISEPSIVGRLNFLQTHNQHNSGYQVARYDLEHRGGGEFLGARQSGHLQNIGYDLYLEMLEDCVNPKEMEEEPEIHLPWPAYIPVHYMPSDKIRLMYYKYLCDLRDMKKLDDLEMEWKDNFGSFPQEVKNLLGQIRILDKCRELKIKELKILRNHVYLTYVGASLKKEKFVLDKGFSWLDVYDVLSGCR